MKNTLTSEQIDTLVARMKAMPRPMEPRVADDGREFYFVAGVGRDQMLDMLPAGYTLRAISFNGGADIRFEPVEIESL